MGVECPKFKFDTFSMAGDDQTINNFLSRFIRYVFYNLFVTPIHVSYEIRLYSFLFTVFIIM